ncbi:MAG: L-threonylcarbamoyladenylate synthase [Chitinophagaceae bacterium]|jgi:tRNA threonylcarbamoyl adenosine modification protein (Sua5/YciO/YrdC/YwlC family)|nr:L-threonylcarbamoyladenylate synthase [Chitinophagaceae bacterium]
MALHLRIHPVDPQSRLIKQVVDCLLKDGVIIYPTDTVYAIGCSMHSREGLQRIARIKQSDPAKALLSFVCHDLKDLSQYARQLDTPVFRLLKQHLPGPFTFILPASREVPKMMQSKKATIGLRVPDNAIARAIAEALGHPILSASVPAQMPEDLADPDVIFENFDRQVDMLVDGGMGEIIPSTVVDLTGEEPQVIRPGKGEWE